MLNRNSPIPLYFQLKIHIKDKIISETYKAGDAIPTESHIMEKYGLSRSTVRQAILELVNEGYLERYKGKGTFVTENSFHVEKSFLGNIKCFSAEMNKKGVSHSTKVLNQKIIKPHKDIARKLGISDNSKTFYLKRLRYVKNKPILLVESYIPIYLCEGIQKENFEENSLYKILETKYDILIHHGKREIQPLKSVADEILKLLEITPDTCLLFMESIVFSQKNIAIEYLQAELLGTFIVNIGG